MGFLLILLIASSGSMERVAGTCCWNLDGNQLSYGKSAKEWMGPWISVKTKELKSRDHGRICSFICSYDAWNNMFIYIYVFFFFHKTRLV